MGFLLATTNRPVNIEILASDGNTALFGQARIYNSAGALVTTLSLVHIAEGLYSVTWTPTTEDIYSAITQLYTDAGHTIDAGYEKGGEQVDVNSERTNILRLLGLVQENSVIDLQTYDSDQNLLSARLRCYDGSANASAAAAISPAVYNTGKLFEYSVTAAYGGGLLSKYFITRVL